MKVKVKRPFYDDTGIHKKGDIVEVKAFDGELMEAIEEKAEKKPAKKTK